MKKYLIIESFPNTPHLETAVEIALRLKKKNKVFFFWIGYDLPWKDWELPLFKRLLLFSFENKVLKIIKFLKENDIEIIPSFDLPSVQNRFINNSIASFKNFNKIKDYKYKKNIPIGLSAFSSLVSKYHTDDVKKFKNHVKPALKSGCIIFERSFKVIQDINPNTIITFNNRFVISKPIIEAAKISKKEVLIHERGSELNKYELYKGDIFDNHFLYKKINTHWKSEKNKKKKIRIAKKYFTLLEKKKFFINKGFNFENNSQNKIDLVSNKKVITYFCSTDYEYISVSSKLYDFYLNKSWSKQINTIKSIIQLIKHDKDTVLYIKSHPNFSLKQNQETELRKLQTNNVIFLSNSDKVDTIYLIKNSHIVITFGSTLELFSLYLDKIVISFFRSFYYKFNLVIYPKNKKILKEALNQKKINIDKDKILKLSKISYYLMTYGIKYKYYKPYTFAKGTLKNQKINHYGVLINFLSRVFFYKYI